MGILVFVVWIAAFGCIAIVFCCFLRFSKWKVGELIELDGKFESYHDNGQLRQKTNVRPVWDYSPCPGMSKILHAREWLAPLVMIMFLIMLVIYLKTESELVAELLKYNFGAFLGSMAQGVVGKKT